MAHGRQVWMAWTVGNNLRSKSPDLYECYDRRSMGEDGANVQGQATYALV